MGQNSPHTTRGIYQKIRKISQEHITSVHEKNKGENQYLNGQLLPSIKRDTYFKNHNNRSKFITNLKDKLVNYWRNIPYYQLLRQKEQHCRIMGTT